MSELIPIGSRIIVQDVEPIDDTSMRMRAAGLVPVVLEINKPKPTSGKVLAVGTDPLVQENIRIGDTVLFSRHAGTLLQVEGVTYRSLDFHEVHSVIRGGE